MFDSSNAREEYDNHLANRISLREHRARVENCKQSYEPEDLGHGGDSFLRLHPESGLDDLEAADTNNEEFGHASKSSATAASDIDQGAHSENGSGGSSSHHDGDIEDDVFSQSNLSNRSSFNPYHELASSGEPEQKHSSLSAIGETAIPRIETNISSRISSDISYLPQEYESSSCPAAQFLERPPFRTTSSVRAIQLSSPTPSYFQSSPSAKRNLPTVSQLGSPHSQSSPLKSTPTRLKPRKENPLILLHVSVMPLRWPYSHIMSSPDLPESLKYLQKQWRLLQHKLSDIVLERGILLAHPQDSYETLEERLLEALELPVRPRARILKCGHYMRSSESEEENSSDEHKDELVHIRSKNISHHGRGSCSTCNREVCPEYFQNNTMKEIKFRCKFYASNGLMSAGAWAAAWKEMERVDVEIEPCVEANAHAELEYLSLESQRFPSVETSEHENERFMDDESLDEQLPELDRPIKGEEELRIEAELYEYERREEMRQNAAREYEEQMLEAIKLEKEQISLHHMPNEEELLQERYVDDHLPPSDPLPTRPSEINEDSLLELLLSAFQVVKQDKRNVIIGVLALLVLILALIPRGGITPLLVMEPPLIPEVTTSVDLHTSVEVSTSTLYQEITITRTIPSVATSPTLLETESFTTQTIPSIATSPTLPETESFTAQIIPSIATSSTLLETESFTAQKIPSIATSPILLETESFTAQTILSIATSPMLLETESFTTQLAQTSEKILVPVLEAKLSSEVKKPTPLTATLRQRNMYTPSAVVLIPLAPIPPKLQQSEPAPGAQSKSATQSRELIVGTHRDLSVGYRREL